LPTGQPVKPLAPDAGFAGALNSVDGSGLPGLSSDRKEGGRETRDVRLEKILPMLTAFVVGVIVSASPAAVGLPAVELAFAGDPAPAPADGDENSQAQPDGAPPAAATSEPSAAEGTSPPAITPTTFCPALAAAAAANDLPFAFLARLIWQESGFKAEAVSRAGAQGVAQFMPETARLRGLENPFDPLEAIAESARLLSDLNREFGNLGLAAAAYNAGPGRVRDWLSGRRPLPGETRAYVRIVTGRSAEEWGGPGRQTAPAELPAAAAAVGKRNGPAMKIAPLQRQARARPVELAAAKASAERHPPAEPPTMSELPIPQEVPCSPDGAILAGASAASAAVRATPKPFKPWGVEVVGGPTKAKALARWRELQAKFPSLLADREPIVLISGVISEMGAARVHAEAETRAEAAKLCAQLRAVGWYCDVLRN
jgi:Transglycosylase SLT domain